MNKFDAAAAKSATVAKKTTKTDAKSKANGPPTEQVDSLTLDEAPPPKSKKIDVLAEFGKSTNKPSASFVVVGKRHPVWGSSDID